MTKQNLRENGYFAEERFPKKRMINIAWLIFTLILIIGSYIALTLTIGYSPAKVPDGGTPLDVYVNPMKIPLYPAVLIFAIWGYFFLKLGMTLIFCQDKDNTTKLKFLKDKTFPDFPVCHCREAFKIWQTAVMYLVPVIIVYAFMFILCGFSPINTFVYGDRPFEEIDTGYMTMLFFVSFFMAFDLTLIAYAVFMRVKHKIDYIAVDYHIYGVTLYKKTYVRFDMKKPTGRYLKKGDGKLTENGKFNWKNKN